MRIYNLCENNDAGIAAGGGEGAVTITANVSGGGVKHIVVCDN